MLTTLGLIFLVIGYRNNSRGWKKAGVIVFCTEAALIVLAILLVMTASLRAPSP